MSASELVKVVGGKTIRARESDHYVNATELCKAAGKKWSHYYENKGTREFIQAIAQSTGIPADGDGGLVQMKSGASGGTWIHPRVVIHFAQWASAEFAAAVTGWVLELITTGRVELKSEPGPAASAQPFDFTALRSELISEVVAGIAPALSEIRSLLVRPAPEVSIPGRCKYWGWYPVSKKIEAEIRDSAYGYCIEA